MWFNPVGSSGCHRPHSRVGQGPGLGGRGVWDHLPSHLWGPRGYNGDNTRNGSQRKSLNISFGRDVHFKSFPSLFAYRLLSGNSRKQPTTRKARLGELGKPVKPVSRQRNWEAPGGPMWAWHAQRLQASSSPWSSVHLRRPLAVSRCIPPTQSKPRASTPAVKLVSVPFAWTWATPETPRLRHHV